MFETKDDLASSLKKTAGEMRLAMEEAIAVKDKQLVILRRALVEQQELTKDANETIRQLKGQLK